MATVICQHSKDPEDLHLHDISVLCDGHVDCYSSVAMNDESFPYCEKKCNSTCSHHGACLFDGRRAQCYCNSGFQGPSCELTDTNECNDKPCHWMAKCQNTFGSYRCECYPGFEGNGYECTDIDECADGLADCPSNSVCVNLPGTYMCNCSQGYIPKGAPVDKCVDIDECDLGLAKCGHKLCQNLIGGYKCVDECEDGYDLKDGKCVDLDECVNGQNNCDARAVCRNKPGGYDCFCDDGFVGDGRSCSPIYDCTQNEGICDRHAYCLSSLKMCVCQSGYAGDGHSCRDVNECSGSMNPCAQQENNKCVNVEGGYICCNQVENEEKCLKDSGLYCSGGCGVNAVCFNQTCTCVPGYEGDPKVRCSDVNECHQDNICTGAGQWCVNLPGGHICCTPDSDYPECRGLELVPDVLDPKAIAISDANARNKNANGNNAEANSFAQVNGVRGGAEGDLEETELATQEKVKRRRFRTKTVHIGRQLKTHSGGFVLIRRPKERLFRNETTGEFDIKEIPDCPNGQDSECPEHSVCFNHRCRCRLGFEWSRLKGTCEDVNECLGQNPCPNSPKHKESWCVNTIGGYHCCHTGMDMEECDGMAITQMEPSVPVDVTESDNKHDIFKTASYGELRKKVSKHIIFGRGRIPAQKLWGLELTGKGLFAGLPGFPGSEEGPTDQAPLKPSVSTTLFTTVSIAPLGGPMVGPRLPSGHELAEKSHVSPMSTGTELTNRKVVQIPVDKTGNVQGEFTPSVFNSSGIGDDGQFRFFNRTEGTFGFVAKPKEGLKVPEDIFLNPQKPFVIPSPDFGIPHINPNDFPEILVDEKGGKRKEFRSFNQTSGSVGLVLGPNGVSDKKQPFVLPHGVKFTPIHLQNPNEIFNRKSKGRKGEGVEGREMTKNAEGEFGLVLRPVKPDSIRSPTKSIPESVRTTEPSDVTRSIFESSRGAETTTRKVDSDRIEVDITPEEFDQKNLKEEIIPQTPPAIENTRLNHTVNEEEWVIEHGGKGKNIQIPESQETLVLTAQLGFQKSTKVPKTIISDAKSTYVASNGTEDKLRPSPTPNEPVETTTLISAKTTGQAATSLTTEPMTAIITSNEPSNNVEIDQTWTPTSTGTVNLSVPEGLQTNEGTTVTSVMTSTAKQNELTVTPAQMTKNETPNELRKTTADNTEMAVPAEESSTGSTPTSSNHGFPLKKDFGVTETEPTTEIITGNKKLVTSTSSSIGFEGPVAETENVSSKTKVITPTSKITTKKITILEAATATTLAVTSKITTENNTPLRSSSAETTTTAMRLSKAKVENKITTGSAHFRQPTTIRPNPNEEMTNESSTTGRTPDQISADTATASTLRDGVNPNKGIQTSPPNASRETEKPKIEPEELTTRIGQDFEHPVSLSSAPAMMPTDTEVHEDTTSNRDIQRESTEFQGIVNRIVSSSTHTPDTTSTQAVTPEPSTMPEGVTSHKFTQTRTISTPDEGSGLELSGNGLESINITVSSLGSNKVKTITAKPKSEIRGETSATKKFESTELVLNGGGFKLNGHGTKANKKEQEVEHSLAPPIVHEDRRNQKSYPNRAHQELNNQTKDETVKESVKKIENRQKEIVENTVIITVPEQKVLTKEENRSQNAKHSGERSSTSSNGKTSQREGPPSLPETATIKNGAERVPATQPKKTTTPSTTTVPPKKIEITSENKSLISVAPEAGEYPSSTTPTTFETHKPGSSSPSSSTTAAKQVENDEHTETAEKKSTLISGIQTKYRLWTSAPERGLEIFGSDIQPIKGITPSVFVDEEASIKKTHNVFNHPEIRTSSHKKKITGKVELIQTKNESSGEETFVITRNDAFERITKVINLSRYPTTIAPRLSTDQPLNSVTATSPADVEHFKTTKSFTEDLERINNTDLPIAGGNIRTSLPPDQNFNTLGPTRATVAEDSTIREADDSTEKPESREPKDSKDLPLTTVSVNNGPKAITDDGIKTEVYSSTSTTASKNELTDAGFNLGKKKTFAASEITSTSASLELLTPTSVSSLETPKPTEREDLFTVRSTQDFGGKIVGNTTEKEKEEVGGLRGAKKMSSFESMFQNKTKKYTLNPLEINPSYMKITSKFERIQTKNKTSGEGMFILTKNATFGHITKTISQNGHITTTAPKLFTDETLTSPENGDFTATEAESSTESRQLTSGTDVPPRATGDTIRPSLKVKTKEAVPTKTQSSTLATDKPGSSNSNKNKQHTSAEIGQMSTSTLLNPAASKSTPKYQVSEKITESLSEEPSSTTRGLDDQPEEVTTGYSKKMFKADAVIERTKIVPSETTFQTPTQTDVTETVTESTRMKSSLRTAKLKVADKDTAVDIDIRTTEPNDFSTRTSAPEEGLSGHTKETTTPASKKKLESRGEMITKQSETTVKSQNKMVFTEVSTESITVVTDLTTTEKPPSQTKKNSFSTPSANPGRSTITETSLESLGFKKPDARAAFTSQELERLRTSTPAGKISTQPSSSHQQGTTEFDSTSIESPYNQTTASNNLETNQPFKASTLESKTELSHTEKPTEAETIRTQQLNHIQRFQPTGSAKTQLSDTSVTSPSQRLTSAVDQNKKEFINLHRSSTKQTEVQTILGTNKEDIRVTTFPSITQISNVTNSVGGDEVTIMPSDATSEKNVEQSPTLSNSQPKTSTNPKLRVTLFTDSAVDTRTVSTTPATGLTDSIEMGVKESTIMPAMTKQYNRHSTIRGVKTVIPILTSRHLDHRKTTAPYSTAKTLINSESSLTPEEMATTEGEQSTSILPNEFESTWKTQPTFRSTELTDNPMESSSPKTTSPQESKNTSPTTTVDFETSKRSSSASKRLKGKVEIIQQKNETWGEKTVVVKPGKGTIEIDNLSVEGNNPTILSINPSRKPNPSVDVVILDKGNSEIPYIKTKQQSSEIKVDALTSHTSTVSKTLARKTTAASSENKPPAEIGLEIFGSDISQKSQQKPPKNNGGRERNGSKVAGNKANSSPESGLEIIGSDILLTPTATPSTVPRNLKGGLPSPSAEVKSATFPTTNIDMVTESSEKVVDGSTTRPLRIYTSEPSPRTTPALKTTTERITGQISVTTDSPTLNSFEPNKVTTEKDGLELSTGNPVETSSLMEGRTILVTEDALSPTRAPDRKLDEATTTSDGLHPSISHPRSNQSSQSNAIKSNAPSATPIVSIVTPIGPSTVTATTRITQWVDESTSVTDSMRYTAPDLNSLSPIAPQGVNEGEHTRTVHPLKFTSEIHTSNFKELGGLTTPSTTKKDLTEDIEDIQSTGKTGSTAADESTSRSEKFKTRFTPTAVSTNTNDTAKAKTERQGMRELSTAKSEIQHPTMSSADSVLRTREYATSKPGVTSMPDRETTISRSPNQHIEIDSERENVKEGNEQTLPGQSVTKQETKRLYSTGNPDLTSSEHPTKYSAAATPSRNDKPQENFESSQGSSIPRTVAKQTATSEENPKSYTKYSEKPQIINVKMPEAMAKNEIVGVTQLPPTNTTQETEKDMRQSHEIENSTPASTEEKENVTSGKVIAKTTTRKGTTEFPEKTLKRTKTTTVPHHLQTQTSRNKAEKSEEIGLEITGKGLKKNDLRNKIRSSHEVNGKSGEHDGLEEGLEIVVKGIQSAQQNVRGKGKKFASKTPDVVDGNTKDYGHTETPFVSVSTSKKSTGKELKWSEERFKMKNERKENAHTVIINPKVTPNESVKEVGLEIHGIGLFPKQTGRFETELTTVPSEKTRTTTESTPGMSDSTVRQMKKDKYIGVASTTEPDETFVTRLTELYGDVSTSSAREESSSAFPNESSSENTERPQLTHERIRNVSTSLTELEKLATNPPTEQNIPYKHYRSKVAVHNITQNTGLGNQENTTVVNTTTEKVIVVKTGYKINQSKSSISKTTSGKFNHTSEKSSIVPQTTTEETEDSSRTETPKAQSTERSVSIISYKTSKKENAKEETTSHETTDPPGFTSNTGIVEDGTTTLTTKISFPSRSDRKTSSENYSIKTLTYSPTTTSKAELPEALTSLTETGWTTLRYSETRQSKEKSLTGSPTDANVGHETIQRTFSEETARPSLPQTISEATEAGQIKTSTAEIENVKTAEEGFSSTAIIPDAAAVTATVAPEITVISTTKSESHPRVSTTPKSLVEQETLEPSTANIRQSVTSSTATGQGFKTTIKAHWEETSKNTEKSGPPVTTNATEIGETVHDKLMPADNKTTVQEEIITEAATGKPIPTITTQIGFKEPMNLPPQTTLEDILTPENTKRNTSTTSRTTLPSVVEATTEAKKDLITVSTRLVEMSTGNPVDTPSSDELVPAIITTESGFKKKVQQEVSTPDDLPKIPLRNDSFVMSFESPTTSTGYPPNTASLRQEVTSVITSRSPATTPQALSTMETVAAWTVTNTRSPIETGAIPTEEMNSFTSQSPLFDSSRSPAKFPTNVKQRPEMNLQTLGVPPSRMSTSPPPSPTVPPSPHSTHSLNFAPKTNLSIPPEDGDYPERIDLSDTIHSQIISKNPTSTAIPEFSDIFPTNSNNRKAEERLTTVPPIHYTKLQRETTFDGDHETESALKNSFGLVISGHPEATTAEVGLVIGRLTPIEDNSPPEGEEEAPEISPPQSASSEVVEIDEATESPVDLLKKVNDLLIRQGHQKITPEVAVPEDELTRKTVNPIVFTSPLEKHGLELKGGVPLEGDVGLDLNQKGRKVQWKNRTIEKGKRINLAYPPSTIQPLVITLPENEVEETTPKSGNMGLEINGGSIIRENSTQYTSTTQNPDITIGETDFETLNREQLLKRVKALTTPKDKIEISTAPSKERTSTEPEVFIEGEDVEKMDRDELIQKLKELKLTSIKTTGSLPNIQTTTEGVDIVPDRGATEVIEKEGRPKKPRKRPEVHDELGLELTGKDLETTKLPSPTKPTTSSNKKLDITMETPQPGEHGLAISGSDLKTPGEEKSSPTPEDLRTDNKEPTRTTVPIPETPRPDEQGLVISGRGIETVSTKRTSTENPTSTSQPKSEKSPEPLTLETPIPNEKGLVISGEDLKTTGRPSKPTKITVKQATLEKKTTEATTTLLTEQFLQQKTDPTFETPRPDEQGLMISGKDIETIRPDHPEASTLVTTTVTQPLTAETPKPTARISEKDIETPKTDLDLSSSTASTLTPEPSSSHSRGPSTLETPQPEEQGLMISGKDIETPKTDLDLSSSTASTLTPEPSSSHSRGPSTLETPQPEEQGLMISGKDIETIRPDNPEASTLVTTTVTQPLTAETPKPTARISEKDIETPKTDLDLSSSTASSLTPEPSSSHSKGPSTLETPWPEEQGLMISGKDIKPFSAEPSSSPPTTPETSKETETPVVTQPTAISISVTNEGSMINGADIQAIQPGSTTESSKLDEKTVTPTESTSKHTDQRTSENPSIEIDEEGSENIGKEDSPKTVPSETPPVLLSTPESIVSESSTKQNIPTLEVTATHTAELIPESEGDAVTEPEEPLQSTTVATPPRETSSTSEATTTVQEIARSTEAELSTLTESIIPESITTSIHSTTEKTKESITTSDTPALPADTSPTLLTTLETSSAKSTVPSEDTVGPTKTENESIQTPTETPESPHLATTTNTEEVVSTKSPEKTVTSETTEDLKPELPSTAEFPQSPQLATTTNTEEVVSTKSPEKTVTSETTEDLKPEIPTTVESAAAETSATSAPTTAENTVPLDENRTETSPSVPSDATTFSTNPGEKTQSSSTSPVETTGEPLYRLKDTPGTTLLPQVALTQSTTVKKEDDKTEPSEKEETTAKLTSEDAILLSTTPKEPALTEEITTQILETATDGVTSPSTARSAPAEKEASEEIERATQTEESVTQKAVKVDATTEKLVEENTTAQGITSSSELASTTNSFVETTQLSLSTVNAIEQTSSTSEELKVVTTTTVETTIVAESTIQSDDATAEMSASTPQQPARLLPKTTTEEDRPVVSNRSPEMVNEFTPATREAPVTSETTTSADRGSHVSTTEVLPEPTTLAIESTTVLTCSDDWKNYCESINRTCFVNLKSEHLECGECLSGFKMIEGQCIKETDAEPTATDVVSTTAVIQEEKTGSPKVDKTMEATTEATITSSTSSIISNTESSERPIIHEVVQITESSNTPPISSTEIGSAATPTLMAKQGTIRPESTVTPSGVSPTEPVETTTEHISVDITTPSSTEGRVMTEEIFSTKIMMVSSTIPIDVPEKETTETASTTKLKPTITRKTTKKSTKTTSTTTTASTSLVTEGPQITKGIVTKMPEVIRTEEPPINVDDGEEIQEAQKEEPFTTTTISTATSTISIPTMPSHSQCLSSDECGVDSHCSRRLGKCECDDGFRLKGDKCEDVNECRENSHKCHKSSVCRNYIGGYACDCPIGWRLNYLNQCIEIDECNERNNTLCHPRASCINLQGNYTCQCDDGYIGDGYTCFEDAFRHCNEKELKMTSCNEGHLCLINANGQENCEKCKSGYEMINGTCLDVNECINPDTNKCNINALCINTRGGYICECQNGYKGDGVYCEDVDECSSIKPCHPLARCSNLNGTYMCTCPEGWMGDGRYKCVNPLDRRCEHKEYLCSSEKFHSCLSVNVTADLMSFCECEKGYRYNATTRQCDDIDECMEGRSKCNSTTSTCLNYMGGYSCDCRQGFEGNGGVCVDVDECQRGIHGCHQTSNCYNEIGSYRCKCPAGYAMGENGFCELITDASTTAVVELTTTQKFNLETTTEFEREEVTTSEVPTSYLTVAVTQSPTTLSSSSTKPTPIPVKTTQTAKLQSSATPEFLTSENPIPRRNECTDDWKDYCKGLNKVCFVDSEDLLQCGECLKGYMHENGECIPQLGVGNCTENNNCHPNADCIDSIWTASVRNTHSCVCKKGYVGDGNHCEDVNECNTIPGLCDINAECLNTDGSFECNCNSGYIGNGFYCLQHITHGNHTNCKTNARLCHPNAWCLIDGLCQCQPGYFGDGIERCDLVKLSTNQPVSAYDATEKPPETIPSTPTSTILVSASFPSIISGSSPSESPATATRASPSFAWSLPPHSSFPPHEQTYIIPESSPSRFVPNCVLDKEIRCHPMASCNTFSGQCKCRPGYEGDGFTHCSRVWEDCRSDSHLCDFNAKCNSTFGQCECNPGYIGDGLSCTPDRLDCSAHDDLCSEFADCIGKRCQCKEGYTGDGMMCFSMTAKLSRHDCLNCHCRANCVEGECVCQPGFNGNGLVCLPDPYDCINYPGVCHMNGYCNNATRKCECHQEYVGNGYDCTLRKSCTQFPALCHPDADCLESGQCQCRFGFYGDGIYCKKDISYRELTQVKLMETSSVECATYCGYNQECFNGACKCKTGFSANINGVCIDVDECLTGANSCSPHAKCHNSEGSYQCSCPRGMEGDGHTCRTLQYTSPGVQVECLGDGMRVMFSNLPHPFSGRVYVKGQTDNEYCAKTYNGDSGQNIVFDVNLAHCNMYMRSNNTLTTTLIVQRHPTFVTSEAESYNVQCSYPLAERIVEAKYNIHDLEPRESIAQNGSSPVCQFNVKNLEDIRVDQALVGQILKLTLSVSPEPENAILPRSCYAINLESNDRYQLTDQSGCAIDTELFPEWKRISKTQLQAIFRTFKWPESTMIRFECYCTPCDEGCLEMKCGKRKQRLSRHIKKQNEEVMLDNGTLTFSQVVTINEDEEERKVQKEFERWLAGEGSPTTSIITNDYVCMSSLWFLSTLMASILSIITLITVFILYYKKMRVLSKQKFLESHLDDNLSYIQF
uniref:EGF-like domain protein n=1 Tax=Bursaphelenchus xylophilus TaxID=6326 RepID=A0A1I7STZ4_BURXY